MVGRFGVVLSRRGESKICGENGGGLDCRIRRVSSGLG
jgi:hypothetical protein